MEISNHTVMEKDSLAIFQSIKQQMCSRLLLILKHIITCFHQLSPWSKTLRLSVLLYCLANSFYILLRFVTGNFTAMMWVDGVDDAKLN